MLTTRPAPYLGGSQPLTAAHSPSQHRELVWPPAPPGRIQLQPPHLKSSVAVVHWLPEGRRAQRLSHPRVAPCDVHARAAVVGVRWGGGGRVEPCWSPGFGSPRPFEGRSHPGLGGWILDAFITSYFRPGCWTHAGEPSSLEATEENDE